MQKVSMLLRCPSLGNHRLYNTARTHIFQAVSKHIRHIFRSRPHYYPILKLRSSKPELEQAKPGYYKKFSF
jgi:hypothetical protein